MNAVANQRRSDESSLKQGSFVVQCVHSLTEFCSLANSLIINNEVQMYVRSKYKRCIHHTVYIASLIITGVFLKCINLR